MDVQIVVAVELDMVGIGLLGGLAGEHVTQVALMGNDQVAHLQVLEDGGHDMGNVEIYAVLETRQIQDDGLAFHGIVHQFEQGLALRLGNGIQRAEQQDVVLVDAGPNHVEALLGIDAIVDHGVLAAIVENDGHGSGTCRVAVDGVDVNAVAGQVVDDDVAHTVGTALAHHGHGQSHGAQDGSGIGDTSAHKRTGGLVAAIDGVEHRFADGYDLSHSG